MARQRQGLFALREVPDWSGVPVHLGKGLVMVPLHVADGRPIRLDGWTHEDFYVSLEGDVEYHVYRRTD